MQDIVRNIMMWKVTWKTSLFLPKVHERGKIANEKLHDLQAFDKKAWKIIFFCPKQRWKEWGGCQYVSLTIEDKTQLLTHQSNNADVLMSSPSQRRLQVFANKPIPNVPKAVENRDWAWERDKSVYLRSWWMWWCCRCCTWSWWWWWWQWWWWWRWTIHSSETDPTSCSHQVASVGFATNQVLAPKKTAVQKFQNHFFSEMCSMGTF